MKDKIKVQLFILLIKVKIEIPLIWPSKSMITDKRLLCVVFSLCLWCKLCFHKATRWIICPQYIMRLLSCLRWVVHQWLKWAGARDKHVSETEYSCYFMVSLRRGERNLGYYLLFSFILDETFEFQHLPYWGKTYLFETVSSNCS